MLKRLFISALLLAVLSPLAAAQSKTEEPADTLEVMASADTVSRWAGMALRTNLLWDGIAAPNLGFDIPVSEHVTLGAEAGLKPWPRWLAWDWDTANPVKWRHFAVAPEVRYYLDEVFQGTFFGGEIMYAHYNLSNLEFPLGLYPDVEDYRVQGDFFGAGLSVGYAWWPWQHWRIELEAGAVAGWSVYGLYNCEHCGTKISDENKFVVIPKLGINLSYNTKARDKRKESKQENNN